MATIKRIYAGEFPPEFWEAFHFPIKSIWFEEDPWVCEVKAWLEENGIDAMYSRKLGGTSDSYATFYVKPENAILLRLAFCDHPNIIMTSKMPTILPMRAIDG